MSPKDPLPLRKRIDGKLFSLGRVRKTKRAARNVAQSYREDGFNARLVPVKKRGYAIYVRKKK